MNSAELSKNSNSLGLIFDQGDQEVYPLGSAWLVDPNTVVTCAHNVVLYKDQLAALKIRFPISGKEFAVRSAVFHPKLDLKHLIATAKRALGEPLVALALEKYNVVVLKIAPGVQPLNPEENKALNAIFRADRGESESGLGGNLDEIELALVIQTITNARKEGTVTLVDERGRVRGRLFCSEGRVKHAYYKNLVNEMAVNQIIEHKLAGGFYFTSEEEPDWTGISEINRPTDSLMIEAHRRLDELDKLAGIVGGPSSLFERLGPDPRLEVLPVECREFAKLIWPLLDGGTPLGFMWELCGIDDYSVYMTLQELIKTRQVSYFEAPFVKAGPAIPMQLGTEKAIAVGDEISALWVDDPSMAPLVRTGKILGSLTEFDPAHVIHTVGMPSSASGAPIVKDEIVIGMHCGALPPDISVGPTEGFHQMIWVESIVECLNQAGEKEIVKKLTMSGEQEVTLQGVPATPKVKNPGIREVARILCPKCGRSTLEVTNFCKGCGHRLMKDQAPVKGKKKAQAAAVARSHPEAPVVAKGPPLIWAFVMTLIAFIGGLGALALIPQPHIVPTCMVTIPELRWVEPTVDIYDQQSRQWNAAPPDKIFRPGEILCLDVLVNKPGYFYSFYKGTSGDIALIFPGRSLKDEVMLIGQRFSIGPSGALDKTAQPIGDGANMKQAIDGFSFDEKAGSEKIVLIAGPSRLSFLSQPDLYNGFVTRTLALLEANNSPSGIQTTVEQFGAEYFQAGAKFGTDGSSYLKDPVYLSLVKIDHGAPIQ